jgi:hypothetical protein
VILQEWGRRWPMSQYIDPENAVQSLAADAAVQSRVNPPRSDSGAQGGQ